MDLPYFSIIVPTYNRPSALRRCLDALGRLDYPDSRYEIIVISDGGIAPTLPAAGPHRIRSTVQPRSGPAAARNRGAAMAEGQYLAFIDDDCFPAKNWLLALANSLNKFPDWMIGGRIVNALPHNRYATASQLLVDFLYEQVNGKPDQAQFLASSNMALPRAGFLAAGGFSTQFPLAAGEDREFCRRWLNTGRKILYAPEAVVHHAHPLTFSGFLRQHQNYGRGAYRYHRLSEQGRERWFRPGVAAFYVKLLLYPWKRGRYRGRAVHSILFKLMQSATILGYVRERITKEAKLDRD